MIESRWATDWRSTRRAASAARARRGHERAHPCALPTGCFRRLRAAREREPDASSTQTYPASRFGTSRTGVPRCALHCTLAQFVPARGPSLCRRDMPRLLFPAPGIPADSSFPDGGQPSCPRFEHASPVSDPLGPVSPSFPVTRLGAATISRSTDNRWSEDSRSLQPAVSGKARRARQGLDAARRHVAHGTGSASSRPARSVRVPRPQARHFWSARSRPGTRRPSAARGRRRRGDRARDGATTA